MRFYMPDKTRRSSRRKQSNGLHVTLALHIRQKRRYIPSRPGRIRKSRKEKYKTMDTAGQPVKAKIERLDKHQTGESVRYGCAVVQQGRTALRVAGSNPARTISGTYAREFSRYGVLLR